MNKYAPKYKHSFMIGSCNECLRAIDDCLEHKVWEWFYDWALAMSEPRYEAECSLACHGTSHRNSILVF